mgnify:CR=1 FL=1
MGYSRYQRDKSILMHALNKTRDRCKAGETGTTEIEPLNDGGCEKRNTQTLGGRDHRRYLGQPLGEPCSSGPEKGGGDCRGELGG